MKNIDEIKDKIEVGFKDDFFEFGIRDIIEALPFEDAKPYLTADFVSQPDAEEEWEQLRLKSADDVLTKMKDYLSFAYDKAHNQRGLSADRSIRHFIAWAWLINDDFHQELVDLYDNSYDDYGLSILHRIKEWLGDDGCGCK